MKKEWRLHIYYTKKGALQVKEICIYGKRDEIYISANVITSNKLSGKFDFVAEHQKYITTQSSLPAMFVFSCSFIDTLKFQ